MQFDVTALFNKYAGKEVAVTETPYTRKRRGTDEEYTGYIYKEDENDPVLADLQKDAEAQGLRVRLWVPGRMGTMDMRPNRLNVHIEKDSAGKWRIDDSQPFRLG